MVFGFLGVIIVAVVVLVIILGVAGLVMNQLLRNIDGNGDSFNTKTEEMIPYKSVIKLAVETIIHPRRVIEAEKITGYEREDYRNWLFGLAGVTGFVLPVITQGLNGIISGVIGLFVGMLSVWIISWFFVGFRTLIFRYIGGVNLDYQEGKEVFSIVFLSNYILTTMIELISSLFPNFLAIHLNTSAYVGQSTSISLLGILSWIWIEVIYYFLLLKRYKVSSGESLLKLILMILVSIGITLLVGLMIIVMIFLATRLIGFTG